MTTDPEEGHRQMVTMQPAPLKVGDAVRLSAGGKIEGGKIMTVVALEDYGNQAVCEWQEAQREKFPVRYLVRVSLENNRE